MTAMTDFTSPQRMGPGAFFIYFVKSLRTIFNVVIIYTAIMIYDSDGGIADILLRIAAMLGVIVGIALITASVAYFQIRFHVEDGNLIYRHNIISRTVTTIPLSSVHSLRTKQNVFYKLLDLRGILFDTLAAKGEEVELILSETDWQNLLSLIERQEHQRPAAADTPPAYNPASHMRFSDTDLVLDALCQNHLKGMAVLGGFVAVIFNALNDISDRWIETTAGYIESNSDHFAVSFAGVAVILAATYVLSLVLWLGKVILRYYNLTLAYDSRLLTFSHGLVSRLSSRFAYDKICTVRIKRNFLEKRFGLCTLALRQALNASAQKDDENLRIYGRDSSGFFLSWWLGDGYASQTGLLAARSGKGVITRSLLPDLILSSTAAVILFHSGLYSWIIIPALYLLAGIPKSILAMRHSSITLKETYVTVGNGRFAETTNYLKYSNIGVVRITRSPLTPLTGRVSLTLSTSGTTFTIRSLRQAEAMPIYEALLARASSVS